MAEWYYCFWLSELAIWLVFSCGMKAWKIRYHSICVQYCTKPNISIKLCNWNVVLPSSLKSFIWKWNITTICSWSRAIKKISVHMNKKRFFGILFKQRQLSSSTYKIITHLKIESSVFFKYWMTDLTWPKSMDSTDILTPTYTDTWMSLISLNSSKDKKNSFKLQYIAASKGECLMMYLNSY